MAGILLNRHRQVPAEETPAFGGIAERFRRAGDLDRAIALCRDGLKRFPDQLSARVTLGWALLDKGQYDAARSELEYVLRKAPDNLAAIRGLAELHDRTEGALPADDASWRTEDVVAPATAPADAVVEVPTPLVEAAPEIVHTAAEAEHVAVAAAGTSLHPADIEITPIELEAPAAASMAAVDPAQEPTPFFVVGPTESLETEEAAATLDAISPVPFEVASPAPAAIELESPVAAALAHVQDAPFETGDLELDALMTLATAGSDDATVDETPLDLVGPDAGMLAWATAPDDAAQQHAGPTTSEATLDQDLDWAGLTAFVEGNAPAAIEPQLTSAADAGEVTDDATVNETLAMIEVDAPGVDVDAAAEADVTIAFEAVADFDESSAITMLDEHGEALSGFETPEALEDIDAQAGEDLAEAIRALEAAARRVEARLAPPVQQYEPAAPDELAAFDLVTPVDEALDADEASATTDAGADAAFELVAPDLSDVTFGPDEATDEVTGLGDPAGESDIAEPDLFAAMPGFDVASETDAAIDAIDEAVSEPLGIDVLPAIVERETDEAATTAAVEAELEPELSESFVEAVEIDEIVEAVELEEDAGEAAAVLDLPDELELDELDLHDDADANAADISVVPVDDECAAESEPEVAGEPDAAMDDLPIAALTETPALSADADLDVPTPRAVYDVPVFGLIDALPAVELALGAADVVSGAPPLEQGTVQAVSPVSGATSTRATVAALERFLRQVQARQLALRGEPVA
ncbi:MAG: hypothetical protein ABS36_06565 [Acidobacteria bacterium SCN 69-37]|nr:MAG: hypothetical protein ABS36_06565 [Acidobacteria bacterium SCN 69-37]